MGEEPWARAGPGWGLTSGRGSLGDICRRHWSLSNSTSSYLICCCSLVHAVVCFSEECRLQAFYFLDSNLPESSSSFPSSDPRSCSPTPQSTARVCTGLAMVFASFQPEKCRNLWNYNGWKKETRAALTLMGIPVSKAHGCSLTNCTWQHLDSFAFKLHVWD